MAVGVGVGIIALSVGVTIVAAAPFSVTYMLDAPACPRLAAHAGIVTFVYLAVVSGEALFMRGMWAAVGLVMAIVAVKITVMAVGD